MGSPLAGAWLFFYLAGCGVLLYQGRYPLKKGAVWYCCLIWTIVVSGNAFLVTPTAGSAAIGWILITPPMLALCLRREHLPAYLKCFGTLIAVYSAGLVLQATLHVTYTFYNTPGRYAWPLLDPNNAAVIVNFMLIPALYQSVQGNKKYWFLSALGAAALYATGSRAGMCAAFISALIFLCKKYGPLPLLMAVVWVYAGVAYLYFVQPDSILEIADAWQSRYPIWATSYMLSVARPWTGLGLGTFAFFYQHFKTESYTGGYFAHNDILQFAAEMGWPTALIFCTLVITVALTTCKSTLPAACALLGIFLQAMVEFQFYVPAAMMPMGLALAYCIIMRQESLQPAALRGLRDRVVPPRIASLKHWTRAGGSSSRLLLNLRLRFWSRRPS